MSLAQFDDILEICCEYMALDELERIDRAKNNRVEVRNVRRTVGDKWWEHAMEEIERERELLNV